MSQSRQYRDDQSSYKISGIPRGNPKRYESSGVLRMGGPSTSVNTNEEMQTEAQKQLRELAKKQTEVNITLQGTLGKRKHFERSASHKQSSGQLEGVHTLSQHLDIEHHDQQVFYLQSCGLTMEEIDVYLGSKVQKPAKIKRYGKDPNVISKQVHYIEEKIAKKERELEKADEFLTKKHLSRHEMDLERSITKGDEKSKLLSNLISSGQKGPIDKNDPANMLDEIIDDISKPKTKEISDQKEEEDDSSLCLTCKKLRILEKYGHKTSLRDKQGNNFCRECYEAQKNLNISQKDDVSEEEGKPSIIGPVPKGRLGPWTKLEEVEQIPTDVIERYKLSIDEVKLIPKFKNYDPGTPSNKLFVKNLSPKVTEADLVSLFQRFQETTHAKINYKLLSGRMKGQAFVTFHDISTATKALQLVHGYPLKDRPIIIQYGNKK